MARRRKTLGFGPVVLKVCAMLEEMGFVVQTMPERCYHAPLTRLVHGAWTWYSTAYPKDEDPRYPTPFQLGSNNTMTACLKAHREGKLERSTREPRTVEFYVKVEADAEGSGKKIAVSGDMQASD